eukprot:scaffold110109_cov36-Tisochrysis_lutea.AAC.1
MTKRGRDAQASFPRKSAKEHLLLDARRMVDLGRAPDLLAICRLVLEGGHPEELRRLPHAIAYFARETSVLSIVVVWFRR